MNRKKFLKYFKICGEKYNYINNNLKISPHFLKLKCFTIIY